MKITATLLLLFSSLLINLNLNAQCSIDDVVADEGACNDDNNFFVHINFNFINVGESGFTITGNGMNHGTFEYGDLPVEIGPLSGDCETEWEFVVTDVEFESCNDFAVLGTICCETNEECSITDLIVDPGDCNDEENFFIHINFNYSNVGANGFSVLGNGMDHGDYNYEDLPIEIGPLSGDCETLWEFVVRDNDFEACQAVAELGEICCSGSEECSISNVQATASDCNDDDQFTVSINFDFANVGNEGFSVLGNGLDHGDFEYGDLPIEIGPLPGNCETPWEFVVRDNQFEACSDFTDLGEICCGVECDITDLSVNINGDCNVEGEYEVTIDFEHVGTSGVGFDLFANGEFFGFYSYDDLPLIILFPGSGDPFDELTVCDNDNESCCATVAMASPCACNISNVIAIPSDCNDEGSFTVNLDFDYNNTSDWFTVGGNGMNYGEFMYSELPINVGPLEGDGVTEWEFVVIDLESELCFDIIELGTIDCNTQDCQIDGLIVEAYECDEDDMFLVDLDFEYSNVGDHGFTVTVNEVEYGPFAYDDLFITLGPFDGNCETNYIFHVNDVDFPDCSDVFELGEICCGGCESCTISNITVDPLECTGDGFYSLLLNFEYCNVTNDFFDVYSGDDLIGFYAYSDLPILIEEFPERVNSDYDIITICDNDNPDCCTTEEFMGLDCIEGGDCEIGTLIVEAGECNDDGIYQVVLNFEYANVGENGFSVLGNGNDYGDFEYADLPVEIGPFEGNCESVYELVVIDNEFEDCASDIGFEALCCNEECHIGELQIDPGECTGDGLFLIVLNFEYQNVNSDLFDVYSGDNNVGTYAYADLPITIEEFPERVNSDYDIISVCDSDSETCCQTEEFMGPDCSESGNCEIGNLAIDPGDCNDDDVFYIHLNFEYAGVGNEGFSVLGNGNDYGDFEYGDLPVEIGPFEGNCESTYELVVIDNQFKDCAADGVFEAICCSEACNISSIQVDPGDCTGDGLFSIVLNFDYQNVNSDLFDVYSGDEYIGTFSYANLPITIEHFPERINSDYDIITVCDSDSETCCETEEFMGPECSENGGDCEISALNIDAGTCNDDGIFYIHLNFENANVGENGFSVLGNGNDYGDFEYSSLPIEVGPFEGNCESVYELVVIDNDFETCSSEGEFEALCCNEECNISEIQVDPGECTGDGYFSIVLNFIYENVSSTFFDVYSGDHYIGTFAYADLPVTIEEFPERVNSDYDIITVCDSDSESCCETEEFMGPNCSENGGDCEFGELNIDIGECNDEALFNVFINFEYSGVGNDGFSVMGNGNDYGDFQYSDLPIEIGPLEGDCKTVWEFIVRDLQYEACASDGAIDPVCCGEECSISELEVEPIECINENAYSLAVNFEYSNTSELGFDVYSNGAFIGFYQYENLPIIIEEFPSNPDSEFDQITVCDNDSEVCCASLEFEGIDCSEVSSIDEEYFESITFKNNWIEGKLEIFFPSPTEQIIHSSIIDISGRVIASKNINEGSTQSKYDLLSLNQGLYILILQDQNNIANFKFVSL